MPLRNRITTAWKAATQLGLEQVTLNAVYRVGLRTGHLRRVTPAGGESAPTGDLNLDALLPNGFARAYRDFTAQHAQDDTELLREAGEILSGQVRLFGADPTPLRLAPPAPLAHWTAYEGRHADPSGDPDIKLVWEPARFGWALTLARVYLRTSDDGYAQFFWEEWERFLAANPPNLGPNWSSGQEVALRLIAVTLAAAVFRDSPHSTPARLAALAQSVAQHAERIPPTMLYARAQNNNHLLTESAGLITAVALLPDHPRADEWQRTGWKWLRRGLLRQIAPDGTYSQHSANYHRLMLQTALWACKVGLRGACDFTPAVLERLAAATRWLLARIDPASGRCLNLGSNDGAYILPLAGGGVLDFRPVAQAAAVAFLGQRAYPPGAWDEMSLWLDLPLIADNPLPQPAEPTILRGERSWASLRAVRFDGRPSQADQLHVDLWWQGDSIARDAGSYRYTAPTPWDNTLALTAAHNTVMLDGQEQMLRAGRFLWLDWAQARVLGSQPDRWVEAEHDGYRRLGVLHRRRLERVDEQTWRVIDQLLPAGRRPGEHTAVLHWLLPDWDWSLDGSTLSLRGPEGSVTITITPGAEMQLIQCGALLAGSGEVPPTLGWWSPTYDQKLPALSLRAILTSRLPVIFETTFVFNAKKRYHE